MDVQFRTTNIPQRKWRSTENVLTLLVVALAVTQSAPFYLVAMSGLSRGTQHCAVHNLP